MKKLKKIIALFTVALFCIIPLLSLPLTAQASTPTTYYLKPVGDEWRYIKDSLVWGDSYNRELYYMHQDIKDGDIIVIDGNANIELKLNVSLSNLTVLQSSSAIVHAKSFDEVHVANNTIAAINGNVKSAFVYAGATVNFNNDAQDIYLESPTYVYVAGNIKNATLHGAVAPAVNLGCGGTVEHVKAISDTNTVYEGYNFKKGTLDIFAGTLKTAETDYSKTAPATTTTTKPATGELDDVPKTSDFSVNPVWFLGLAVVCMLGYRRLERR